MVLFLVDAGVMVVVLKADVILSAIADVCVIVAVVARAGVVFDVVVGVRVVIEVV